MTLVEMMVVVAIVGVAAGGIILSFRSAEKSRLRSTAARLSSSIRYLYDRAVTTGKYYRLEIDLTEGSYRAQRSDDRFYLSRDKEQNEGRGKAFDSDAELKRRDEEEEKRRQQLTGLAAQLQPPPMPRRAHFQAFQDSMLPTVALQGIRLRDLYTPRQTEAYKDGKAYLYFFPDGHTERAVIHLENGDEDVYTLIVHPLSGRVELKPGDIEVPRGFDDTDEEGQREAGR